MEDTPDAVAIVGPTATGKTRLAVAVARRLDGEVISVDSRQAYRGMAVGTAAPTEVEREGVPHHGVGILDPAERYAAGRFADLARGWIEEIRGRGHVPVLAGGTGLFLHALLEPVFREPRMGSERRRRLREWLGVQSEERLRRWANRLDPNLARRLATVDRQRAARTVELALLSGRPVTWWQAHGEPTARPLRAISYVLTLPAEEHRRRIAARAAHLLEAGWLEEVRALLAAGHENAPAMDAVGYREIVALARGELEAQSALAAIVRATWGYARRQRTWYRNRLRGATRLDARQPTEQLADRILADWTRRARPAGFGCLGRDPAGGRRDGVEGGA
ncbi:MAG: tRNA (adenosine(37)-N6)-dimethylallyltransferase MiaA [Gemmatimonadota bacterium]